MAFISRVVTKRIFSLRIIPNYICVLLDRRQRLIMPTKYSSHLQQEVEKVISKSDPGMTILPPRMILPNILPNRNI